MNREPAAGTRVIAVVTALSMGFSPAAPLVAAPAAAAQAPGAAAGPPKPSATPAPLPGASPKPAAAKPASPAPASPPPPPDGGWPRAYQTASGGKIIMYQPQVASWDNQKHLVAFSAVSYEPKGAKKPDLGTLKIEADTKVAVAERLVNFHDFKITESNFPTLVKEQTREVVAEIDKAVPTDDRVLGLDRVLASVDKSQIIPKEVPGMKADPPGIFYSDTPAILVNIDGDPIWSPIKDNDLKYAVNTNWDLFEHESTKTFYLRNDTYWLKAADVKGPWAPAGTLPDSFKKLPAEENWKDVKAALPGKKVDAKSAAKVFVSTTPAEMILVTGKPAWQAVPGTKLQWLSNTESDVFRMGEAGDVYFLVSGRWFSATTFAGPWTFASPKLPEDFKEISLEHPRSRVLASVPGTQQAAEGVLLAQVPQTARVNKKELKAPEVEYQGEPKFEPIEKTTVSQAVNTDKQIIKVGDLYYMCFQGVWFMSKKADGPWEVTSKVPKEIYEIPASSSAHNVTYVTVVEEDDDDDWVTFAAVAGFTGLMIGWGCAVWGTGYYYPPYWGMGGFYPYYYPRYPTYGFGASYNPWTGAYRRGAVAYGPYGGAGVSARYNPRTGTYSRGAAAWGPYGARGYGEAYNPRTGAYGQTRQGSNVYGSWGSTSVQRGNQWAQTNRYTNRATGATTRTTRGSGGGEAITRNGPGMGNNAGIARTGSGDVYAGRDGNVYKRNEGGGWTQQGGVARPTTAARTTTDQLNRDYQARTEGAQRTRDYGSYQSSSGSRSSGSSYRSSGGGGGYRGGGGSRGGGGGRRR